MKKNIFFILGLITAFIAMCSLTFVSSTWAKYTSKATGFDTARVARWSWEYEKDGSNNVLIDIFNNTTVYELNVLNEPWIEPDQQVAQGEALVTPGTGGKFELVVTNESEVTGKVSFEFEVTGANVPLQYKINNGEWTDTLSDIPEEVVDMGDSKTVIIYWRWLFERGSNDTEIESNDTFDTQLGNESNTVTVKVTANFEQVD